MRGDGFFVVLVIALPSVSVNLQRLRTRTPGRPLEDRELKTTGITIWAGQIKSLLRRLRRSARAKRGRKMINCDYSYIVTILLILIAVAAGLLMYALCVVSKNADKLADNMYSRMIQHDISMDNHSHWEK